VAKESNTAAGVSKPTSPHEGALAQVSAQLELGAISQLHGGVAAW